MDTVRTNARFQALIAGTGFAALNAIYPDSTVLSITISGLVFGIAMYPVYNWQGKREQEKQS